MKNQILSLKYSDKYYGGTRITLIEEDKIEGLSGKIVQIMPLASGKFLVEIAELPVVSLLHLLA